jgi:hypothetical protein
MVLQYHSYMVTKTILKSKGLWSHDHSKFEGTSDT